MRTCEEIDLAIEQLMESYAEAWVEQDADTQRLILRLTSALLWVRGEDNAFGRMISELGAIDHGQSQLVN